MAKDKDISLNDILNVAAFNGSASFVAQHSMHITHKVAFFGRANLVRGLDKAHLDVGLPMDTPVHTRFFDKLVLPAGATPLIVATIMGNSAVVRELVKRGANKDKKDNTDMMPVLWACKYNRAEALKILVEAGAALSGEHFWVNPLAFAAFYDAADCVKYLLTLLSIDAHAQDANGETALHKAANAWSPDAVAALLAKGSDPTLRNKWGKTALDLAQEGNGNFEEERAAKQATIKLLLRK